MLYNKDINLIAIITDQNGNGAMIVVLISRNLSKNLLKSVTNMTFYGLFSLMEL